MRTFRALLWKWRPWAARPSSTSRLVNWPRGCPIYKTRWCSTKWRVHLPTASIMVERYIRVPRAPLTSSLSISIRISDRRPALCMPSQSATATRISQWCSVKLYLSCRIKFPPLLRTSQNPARSSRAVALTIRNSKIKARPNTTITLSKWMAPRLPRVANRSISSLLSQLVKLNPSRNNPCPSSSSSLRLRSKSPCLVSSHRIRVLQIIRGRSMRRDLTISSWVWSTRNWQVLITMQVGAVLMVLSTAAVHHLPKPRIDSNGRALSRCITSKPLGPMCNWQTSSLAARSLNMKEKKY